jgi:ribosome-binding factor A
MGELRLKRIESLLREEMSLMISLGRIKDPRIAPLTVITEVQVSKDMRYAKAFVSFHGDGEILEHSVIALNHAAGFIQSALAKRITIRMMPRITFVADHSIERGVRIAKILRDVVN